MPKEEKDQLKDPPPPSWRGFMKGTDETLVESMRSVIEEGRRDQLQRLQQLTSDLDYTIEDYAQALRKKRDERSKAQAQLRSLRHAEELGFDAEAVLRDIAYIKTLPGVMGMRLERGKVWVHIRTSGTYNDKRYDMGDFEVCLGKYTGTDPRGVLDIVCTRTGTKPYPPGDYYYYREHPYFHGEVRRNGTADGWFCFGARAGQIRDLRDKGEYGQMMHLVINTMNSITEGSEDYFARFVEIPLTVKEELKRRAVLRRSGKVRRPKIP